jgi:hypothetical protein
MTDIHDHPSYGVIDDVFANSSNVTEFEADAVAVGHCGSVLDPGCIRLAASGSGPMGPGAAAVHLDPAAALQLLAELARTLGAVVLHQGLPHPSPAVVDRDGDHWYIDLRSGGFRWTYPHLSKELGPLTLAVADTKEGTL